VPDLRFQVESAAAVDTSAGPALALRLLIANACKGEQVHSIALTVQLQIEPARRRYTEEEKRALANLFGEPARWSTTVRPLFWSTINAPIPGFTTATQFDLQIPPPESGIASDKYLRATAEGDIPVVLLFSGRVLYLDNSFLQMAPIPWSQEASYRIPAPLCHRLLSQHQYAERGVRWS
jgi:Family of unknown function (DUF6084)